MKLGPDYLPENSVYPHKGLNTLDPSTLLDPNYSPFERNMWVTKGLLTKRPGYMELGSTPQSPAGVDITEKIVALVEFEDDSDNKTLLAISTTRQYEYDTSNEEWDEITQVGTAYSIDGVNQGTKTFTISDDGDLSSTFTVASSFLIAGSTGNDKIYTVSSRSFSSPDFTIIVDQTIPDSTADGTVAAHVLWTGDEDDWVDWAIGTETSGRRIHFTNGKDTPITWGGSGVFTKFSPNLTDYVTNQTFEVFRDRLFMGNVTTSSNETQLIVWSDIADFDEFEGETSGSNIFVDSKGKIEKLKVLGDRLAVYSEDSISLVIHVGGTLVFIFEKRINQTRLLSPRTIVDIGPWHLYASVENFYLFDGTRMVRPIGDVIHRTYREEVSVKDAKRAFAIHDQPKQKVFWVIPIGTAGDESVRYVLEYDIFRTEELKWVRDSMGDRPTSYGFFSRDTTLKWNSNLISGFKWGDFAGPWNSASAREDFPVRVFGGVGKVFIEDETQRDDDGVAIDSVWDSMDFVLPQIYQSEFGRWIEVELEMRGVAVDILYSTDKGNTFTTIKSAQVLTSGWSMYKFYLDTVSKSFRVRLRNTARTSYFQMRFLRVWVRRGGV